MIDVTFTVSFQVIRAGDLLSEFQVLIDFPELRACLAHSPSGTLLWISDQMLDYAMYLAMAEREKQKAEGGYLN